MIVAVLTNELLAGRGLALVRAGPDGRRGGREPGELEGEARAADSNHDEADDALVDDERGKDASLDVNTEAV